MHHVKSILGYTWAALALLVGLATYMGNEALSRLLVSAAGVVVSPRYTGGQIVRTIDHGPYKTDIHVPVFIDFPSRATNGFIQINWRPAAGLPPLIREAIDADGDGRPECTVTLDTATGTAGLASHDPTVLSLGKTYRLRDGWAARIDVRRP